MIVLYNILFFIGITLGFPLIVPIVLASDKSRKTVLKRLGLMPLPEGIRQNMFHRLDKKPIWIHTLSVGEVLVAMPLAEKIRLRYPHHRLVCSVSTQDGYEMATKSLAKEADFVFFFPYDFVWNARHLVRRIDPLLFVLVETDLWPNFLHEMSSHGVPTILVNGRLSPRSYRNYKRISFFMRSVFSNISFICAQTETDAKRFAAIGVPEDKMEVTGSLKFDQSAPSVSEEEVSKLRASFGIRPSAKVFLAGSTHQGEEAILLRCFKVLKRNFPDLVLVVVPRDTRRAEAVQRLFKQAGWFAPLRTELDNMGADAVYEVVVVNTIGELRRLYAIADVVFVGKSLVNLGGQNPFEPAALKKPIIFGPYMFNFELIAQMLVREGGAFQVANGDGLLEQVRALLRETERSHLMGQRAYEVFCMNQGAVDRVLRVVERFLRPCGPEAFRDHMP